MVFDNAKVIAVFRWRLAATLFLCCLLLLPSLLLARTHHYTSFSDRPELFRKAIADYKNLPHAKCELNGKAVRGGIVTHHFLANEMMVDFFECLVSQTNPERIILIGPDHFRKGLNGISLSSLPWKTPFGEMKADTAVVKEIKHTLALEEDVEAFSGEHSVGILIPFLRYYFPESKVVPILLQKQTPQRLLALLVRLLRQYADDPKTVILLSMDFSHNQTSDEADRRDAISKDAIQNFNLERIDKLDIDSPLGLFLLMTIMRESGSKEVYFRHHSNSSRITGIKDQKNVTSYYTVFFYRHTGKSEF